MKVVRIISDFCVVASTTAILIVLSNYSFTQVSQQPLVEIFLHVMHVSLLVAVIFNTIYQVKNKQWGRMVMTLFPGICLIGAFIFSFYNIRVDGVGLLIYDFYLIFYFYFLLINEFRPPVRRRTTYY